MACDIILPVYNNLDLTKECIESVFKHTDYPFQLIIVDDGSTEASLKAYLKGLADTYSEKIRLIELPQNSGFAKAVNAGIKAGGAEYVCILNNDTIVTKGWLEHMVTLAEAHPDIGIINPLSHSPRRGSVEELGQKIAENRGAYLETSACVGFCMLIRRHLFDIIEILDERYLTGYFEDTDFSRRAIEAGFRCAVALDSYVYHKGSRTFSGRKRDVLFERNRELFYSRWGKPLRILVPIGEEVLGPKEEDGLIRSASKGNWLWLVLNDKTKQLHNARLLRHTNIRLDERRTWQQGIYCLYLLLKRRKKPFNYIWTFCGKITHRMERLRFLHRRRIVELNKAFEG